MAFDTFLKIDGVDGESAASGMEKQIEIYSFSWGESNNVNMSGGGHAAGKASFADLNVMKKLDKASPVLMKKCAAGEHIKSAILTMRKATGTSGQQQAFAVITLSDVMISSIQLSGSSGGDDTPTESVSLAYAKMKVEYSQQGNDGKLTKAASFEYDLKASKAT